METWQFAFLENRLSLKEKVCQWRLNLVQNQGQLKTMFRKDVSHCQQTKNTHSEFRSLAHGMLMHANRFTSCSKWKHLTQYALVRNISRI